MRIGTFPKHTAGTTSTFTTAHGYGQTPRWYQNVVDVGTSAWTKQTAVWTTNSLALAGTTCYMSVFTVLTSQLPLSKWHDQIGDPTVADGILDRLVHNAHTIEMRGESMRKNRGRKSEGESET